MKHLYVGTPPKDKPKDKPGEGGEDNGGEG